MRDRPAAFFSRRSIWVSGGWFQINPSPHYSISAGHRSDQLADLAARLPGLATMINLINLSDDARCSQTVRDRRWPDAERRWLRSAWTEATLQHFTVRLVEAPEGVPTLVVEDRRMPLREVARARQLARGTWHRHERALTACFDLPRDTSRLDHGQLPIAAESGSKRDVLIIRFH
jgi:hypothetical protein